MSGWGPYVESVIGQRPDDAAWRVFAPALAHAFERHVRETIRVQGYADKPKRRVDIITDHDRYETLAGVASQWPGHPLGRTSGAVRATLADLLHEHAA